MKNFKLPVCSRSLIAWFLVGWLWARVTAVYADNPQNVADPAPHSKLQRVGVVDGRVGDDSSAFDRAGLRFITQSDHNVRVWDARTLQSVSKPLEHPESISKYSLSGDGNSVLTICNDRVRIWDVETSEVRFSKWLGDRVTFAEISHDGRAFVYQNRSAFLQVWRVGEDTATKKVIQLDGTDSAQFDPAGRRLLTEICGLFRIWSINDEKKIAELEVNDGSFQPYRAQFDAAGDRVVTPVDHGFAVFDCRTNKIALSVHLQPESLSPKSVRFSRDGSKVLVITAHSDPVGVQLYSAETGGLLSELKGSVVTASLVNAGRWIVYQADNSNTKKERSAALWDPERKQILQTFGDHFEQANLDGSVALFASGPRWKETSVWRVWSDRATTQPTAVPARSGPPG